MAGHLPLGQGDDASEIPSAELLEDRVQQALALLREVRDLWQQWRDALDIVQADTGRTIFADLQDRTLRASWANSSNRSKPDSFAWFSAANSPFSKMKSGKTPVKASCLIRCLKSRPAL